MTVTLKYGGTNNYNMKRYLLLTTACVLVIFSFAQTSKDVRTLIVFFDGLRPDYITAEAMPNLYAFRKQGAYGKQHHSVFPTVTRVNSSSYSTGSYPAKNGLMGNSVYFPEIDKRKALNTGEASELNRIAEATHGQLLTAISLGEILESAGARMMVFSSGSSGQALLQNHRISGGAVIHPTMILPDSLKEYIIREIGPIPQHEKPNSRQHQWVTDALLKYGLIMNGPLVSAIWFSDPDGTAHSDGIGSVTAMQSIKSVDEQFGRIVNALKSRKLDQYFNVIISTDHGFVTHTGTENLSEFLISGGLKKDKESEDVVLAGGAIYVAGRNEETIKKIVSALQSRKWVGAIFTKGRKPGDMKGWVEGTLSFESIHWNHPSRAADILVDANWSDSSNAFGYKGMSSSAGVAGHGSSSPYEIHIPLIASGPSFRKGYESDLPTSNVDITPTVLYLHQLKIPANMDGRVMTELLNKTKTQSTPVARKETIETSVSDSWGSYTLILNRSLLGNHSYVNFTRVMRLIREDTSGKQKQTTSDNK
jgi:predicted AlkP superfamily pyrophosphatase or phosphodiesterase